jgi:hypothetical protein
MVLHLELDRQRKMTHYRVYTGPTQVKNSAERLTVAGLHVTLEGTEHVYVEAGSQEQVLAALNTPHNSGWTWRDVYALTADR